MATTITRRAYAAMYGPTVGDRIRLADTELHAEIGDTGQLCVTSNGGEPSPVREVRIPRRDHRVGRPQVDPDVGGHWLIPVLSGPDVGGGRHP